MTSPQTVAIAAIDEDRKFLLAMVKAIGGDPRARPDHSRARIARFVKALREGATFPAILLVAARDGKLFLLDGFHRIEASKAVGRATIGAIVWQERDFLGALPLAALSLGQGQRSALLLGHIF